MLGNYCCMGLVTGFKATLECCCVCGGNEGTITDQTTRAIGKCLGEAPDVLFRGQGIT